MVFHGQWKDDKQNGYGIVVHSSGDTYEGNWRNFKAHGKGRYIHYECPRPKTKSLLQMLSAFIYIEVLKRSTTTELKNETVKLLKTRKGSDPDGPSQYQDELG